jgi:Flp pilus assembly protein TadG
LASSRARSTFRANLPFFLMCAGLVELCSYAHMFTRRVSGADDAEDTAAQGDAEDAADQSETSASGSTAVWLCLG